MRWLAETFRASIEESFNSCGRCGDAAFLKMLNSYNVHGLVKIQATNASGRMKAQLDHQLREFRGNFESDPDIVVGPWRDAPSTGRGTISIGGYYEYGAEGLLRIAPEKVAFNLLSSPLEIYSDSVSLPINLLVQIILMRQGYTLAHAAGVEFRGKRYLFPSFGGVGKTTLVAGLMFQGARLFGDDLCVANGSQILPFPIDFSVYPSHVRLLRLRDKRLHRTFGWTKPLSRAMDRLAEIQARPAKLLRYALGSVIRQSLNVPPRGIFGASFMAAPGRLDEVAFLERNNGVAELRWQSADAVEMADRCADILLLEWHESMEHLLLYRALSGFGPEEIRNAARQVLAALFGQARCGKIVLPPGMPDDDYQRSVQALLGS
jgi:hypothetical protein